MSAVAPAIPIVERNPRVRRYVLYASLTTALAAVVTLGASGVWAWGSIDLLIFLEAAVWLWWWAQHGSGFPWHPLFAPVLAFGAWVGVQWFGGLSRYPGSTLTGSIQLAGCACMLLLSYVAGTSVGNLRRLFWCLWLVCGVISAEAILQLASAGKYIYWFRDATYGTPVGPYVYHNHFAGFLLLVLPPAVCVALQPQRQRGRPVWESRLYRGAVPVLGAVAMLLSLSRGGLLSLILEGLAGLTIFWGELRRSRRTRLTLVLGLALLIGIASLTNWTAELNRFVRLGARSQSLQDRVQLDRASWQIFLAHPWTGTGFNTFASVYPAYELFDIGKSVEFAHDDYAQMLAETGIPGVLAVLAFLMLLGASFRRSYRDRVSSPSVRPLKLALFVALLGFLFESAGDFQFHSPANALLFFLLCGFAVAPPIRAARSGSTRERRAQRATRQAGIEPGHAPSR